MISVDNRRFWSIICRIDYSQRSNNKTFCRGFALQKVNNRILQGRHEVYASLNITQLTLIKCPSVVFLC